MVQYIDIVRYFLYIILLYNLRKTEISSVNLIQLHVRLQIFNSPLYNSEIYSKMMTEVHNRNM